MSIDDRVEVAAGEASLEATPAGTWTPAAPAARAWAVVRAALARPGGDAWGAILVAAAFIGLTCWWLTQDRSIPVYDAGDHLQDALLFHDMLASGNLLGPLSFVSIYPPLAVTVGAIAALVGGVGVAPPIVGENLVFVPLLALGCYRTGRLLFDSRAGLLAVVFALGSPLLIAQLHVFMLDAPETAMVAVSIWLLLECDRFSRPGMCAWAGLAVGAGTLVKVQYPPFVIGIVLMALLRGGWRNWRGLGIFAAVAAVIVAPWYLDHLAELSEFVHVAGPHAGVPAGDTPPTFSLANFAWYFWNILNSQFLAPLFALIVGGTIWMALTLWRTRGGARHAPRLDFFVGAVVAWLLVTAPPSHDVRYAMPLIPYLAVIATGWIVYLPRPARLLATALVVLGVLANTAGTTFGLGGVVQLELAHPLPAGEEAADSIVVYSNQALLVAGPRRDGDVPGLLVALRRDGVGTVSWGETQSAAPDFSAEGLIPLAHIAGLRGVTTRTPEFARSAAIATLLHGPVGAHSPPACTRLSDGTGVWVVRYDPAAGRLALYCPDRSPAYYDPGAVS
ncbi:MAG TPA: glycosyltransferase family 39 protein [Solirubrobacteraceae bacterium]|nr:glycosyltransferase family 39 protein [Solirubrobacteraceae bacterium]